MVLSGLSPDGRLVEVVELPEHPWFVGVQFHPELKSRPNRAHPLFQAFIQAARAFSCGGFFDSLKGPPVSTGGPRYL